MRIKIGKHDWVQVDGDVNPGTYGGTIAKADGHAIELLKIQPVRYYVGDSDALDVGVPFWTHEGYFNMSDLNLNNEDVKSALEYTGLLEQMEDLRPESRAMAIAVSLLDYGRGDEGPSGWAKDIVPGRVKWWGSERPRGWRYLEDEDKEFRQLLRENR